MSTELLFVQFSTYILLVNQIYLQSYDVERRGRSTKCSGMPDPSLTNTLYLSFTNELHLVNFEKHSKQLSTKRQRLIDRRHKQNFEAHTANVPLFLAHYLSQHSAAQCNQVRIYMYMYFQQLSSSRHTHIQWCLQWQCQHELSLVDSSTKSSISIPKSDTQEGKIVRCCDRLALP